MAINNYMKWPAARISQDENNRLVTNLQISTWNGKADADHNHDDTYLKLSGGAITGYLRIEGNTVFKSRYVAPAGNDVTVSLGNPAGIFEDMYIHSIYVTNGKGLIELNTETDPDNTDARRAYIQLYCTDSWSKIIPPRSKNSSVVELPATDGILALKSDIPAIPESIKNPNVLSVQLNSGTATTYDGSTAKSINITPASIGAAASGDLAKYIPLDGGSTEIKGNIAPSANTMYACGTLTNPWSTMFTRTFQMVEKEKQRFSIYPIGDFVQFTLFDTKSSYHMTIDPEVLAETMTANVHIQIPVKDGTIALLGDIPTTLPASDVSDWAKAASKPSYTWTEIGSKPDTFVPSAHSHAIADVTGLQVALNGKAASSHTHAISEVTNLQSTLDGKAAKSHTHGDADITSVAASKITGTISIDNLPQGALDRLVRVDDDAARFKLTTANVQLGDTVKVKDTGLMYYVVDESKLGEEAGYEPYTAGSATSVPWSGVTGKPSTFTPASHTHAIADITNLQTTLDGKAASSHNHDTVYSKLGHGHAIADVSGLQTALDGKAASSHTHTKSQITDFPASIKNPTSIVIKLNNGTTEGTNMFTYDGSAAKSINITASGIGAAASSHGHAIADVTNLQTTLDGKAASSHTHTIANITNLQTTLDGKAASSHTHTKDQVGLGNVDNTADSAKNVAMATKLQTYKNGSTTETYGTQYPLFAQWDSTGKIINMVCTGYTVRVASAATADSANAVTWGNVSGKPSTFTPASHSHTVANITDFPASIKNPTSLSIQLNGGTATTYDGSAAKSINITPSGIGAAAASHTHDDRYYTETEIDTKLNGKAASSHTHTIANITNLQTTLDGKAASSHTHTIANVTNLQTTLDSKVNNAPTLVTNWNSATNTGYYYAAKGATNAPESTLGYFGEVCKSTTSIMQIIYPEGASGDIKQYMRRGTISGSTITWESNWACITYALS